MQIRGKNILLISPEHWDHIYVSKHHYAIHLANRGNVVFFLNPPSTFNSNRVSPTSYPNLSSIDYKGFIAGLRFFPNWLQRYCIRKKFEYLQRLVSVRFDIVWSFDNSVFFDFSSLPPTVLKICSLLFLYN
jgi:hypothetical protein